VFNLIFWFSVVPYITMSSGCDPPSIFMFSRQQLREPMIKLGQTAAVIIAIVVFHQHMD